LVRRERGRKNADSVVPRLVIAERARKQIWGRYDKSAAAGIGCISLSKRAIAMKKRVGQWFTE